MNRPSFKFLLLLWTVVVLFTGCARTTPELTPYWPTEGWRTSTPEQRGMNSELLVQMLEFVERADLNLHSVLVIRNGYIVAEVYFYPFQQDGKHQLICATKSLISALVGIAIENGHIDGEDHQVLDFFPERTVANDDVRKQAMTLEHLLANTSGLDWPNDLGTYIEMLRSKDWIQFVLDRPMVEEPGSKFTYSTGNPYLLSAILSATTGMDTLSFAQERLFGPLGISNVYWEADPNGVLMPADLQLTSRDMARFGYLYLNNGVWDGQQIVPADWVAASVKEHIDTPWEQGYGYQWWVWPFGAYVAQGGGGQCVFVLPELDIVVVSTGGLESLCNVPGGLVEDFVIPAAESSEPLPENRQAVAQLESLIEQASLPPDPESALPPPAMAQNVSGKTYVLEDNVFDWQSFALDFSGEEARIGLSAGGKPQEWAIGLDNVYRITQEGQFGSLNEGTLLNGPVALRGSWQGDGTFLLDLQFLIGSPYEVSFDFEGDGVVVTVKDVMRVRFEDIPGVLQK